MAVPPHGMPQYNRDDPARGRHGADVCGARRRSRLRRSSSSPPARTSTTPMRGASAPRCSPLTPASATWSSSCSNAAPTRTPRRAGFTALHAAIMRRHEPMVAALLAHGADANTPLRTWTPTRRSSKRLQLSARARGRDAVLAGGAIRRPCRHASAAEARRRSARRAPRGLSRGRAGDAALPGHDGADGGDRNGRRDGLGRARPRRARSADRSRPSSWPSSSASMSTSPTATAARRSTLHRP